MSEMDLWRKASRESGFVPLRNVGLSKLLLFQEGKKKKILRSELNKPVSVRVRRQDLLS